ncbi:hypothetical protein [Streptomyces sp. NPDC048419]|uniref:hypothetical protein n=1 Tax=Streptomyces sp. NPDC048419 TaxID=3365547 RepID=UPI00371669FA
MSTNIPEGLARYMDRDNYPRLLLELQKHHELLEGLVETERTWKVVLQWCEDNLDREQFLKDAPMQDSVHSLVSDFAKTELPEDEQIDWLLEVITPAEEDRPTAEPEAGEGWSLLEAIGSTRWYYQLDKDTFRYRPYRDGAWGEVQDHDPRSPRADVSTTQTKAYALDGHPNWFYRVTTGDARTAYEYRKGDSGPWGSQHPDQQPQASQIPTPVAGQVIPIYRIPGWESLADQTWAQNWHALPAADGTYTYLHSATPPSPHTAGWSDVPPAPPLETTTQPVGNEPAPTPPQSNAGSLDEATDTLADILSEQLRQHPEEAAKLTPDDMITLMEAIAASAASMH